MTPLEAKYGKSLTQRQREIYDFIEEFQRETGTTPTLEVIGKAIGVTFSTVNHHIEAMIVRKALSRGQGRTELELNPEYARGVYVKVGEQ